MRNKICVLSVVMVLSLLLTSYFVGKQQIVRPPVRESFDVEMSASFARHYTFEEAFEEADLVVHVRVGNWLGEDEYSTYYETKVVTSYKGDCNDEIVLLQDGTSKGTYIGYPLFTHGNEMLVFLKSAVDTEYDNAYWIIGGWTTLLDAMEDGTGDVYYVDRSGVLGESIDVSLNVASDTNLKKVLYENARKKDELVASVYSKSKYVYEKASVEELLIRFTDK